MIMKYIPERQQQHFNSRNFRDARSLFLVAAATLTPMHTLARKTRR
jgi:hypothetical protein